jgi:hypothetical protein|nr:MAG TPA: hypothetical protein [Caudoviricetes sp.]DAX92570.1 MAG TPA: hypothetical protein [Caudoviricetes sp.]
MTDKIKAYKAKLCEALEACMAEPVSSRSVGSCTMLMDALCKADKITMESEASTFTEDDARRWTEHMENDDGSMGAHWTLEQTTAVANSIGVHVDPWIWFAALNMEYSDNFDVAQKYGLDRPEYYADLAKAFLFDKDGGGPEAKIAGYYHGIVEPRLERD